MGKKKVSMSLHKEFKRHLRDLNRDVDRRIKALEDNITDVHEIATSVSVLAKSINSMADEQNRQRSELTAVHEAVLKIDVTDTITTMQCTVDRHEERLDTLEKQPQDSVDHENRLRNVESLAQSNTQAIAKLTQMTEDQEKRLRNQESADGKKYKELRGWIIAGFISAMIIPAVIQFFRGG